MDKLKRWKEERRIKKEWESANADVLGSTFMPSFDDLGEGGHKLRLLNARNPGLTHAQLRANREAEHQRLDELQTFEKARKARLRAAKPDATANPFEYQPLLAPHAQIRLIEVRSATDNVVYCHIASHELSRLPSFVAISYTWGTDNDDQLIYLNSRPHMVRRNCWSALQQVTERKLLGWIWLDAICINQSDNAERAKQVQMMTTIFEAADWVAIVPQQRIVIDTMLRHVSFAQHMIAMSKEIVKAIFNDPYFTRIWTVQEILVAKEIRIFIQNTAPKPLKCSEDDVETENDWLFLSDLEGLVDTAASAGWPPSGGFERVQRLVKDVAQEQKKPKQLSQYAYTSHASNVFRYLIKYDDLSCEEPRDRIYALLPMALRGTKAPALVPNYDKPLIGVLSDLIQYMDTLNRTQYSQSGSSFSDMLVCLMKLTLSFDLTLDHPEVQSFFKRRLEETSDAATTHESLGMPAGAARLNGPEYLEFRGICIKDVNDSRGRIALRSIENLPADVATRMHDMGFNTAHDTTSQGEFCVVCDGTTPALITTTNVRAGDIVLTPFAGPMAWTWNLVFRASPGHDNRYDLVGQAVPLKGGNRAQLGRGKCCQDDNCPARSSGTRVHLHPDDVLSLALLSRAPVERLKRPATTLSCGSYAIVSGRKGNASSMSETGSSTRYVV